MYDLEIISLSGKGEREGGYKAISKFPDEY